MSTGAVASAVRSCSTSSTGIDCVEVAEEPEPRRLRCVGARVDERGELREARGDDAAAVEADRRAERALRRDEERHAPAEAEADDADAAVGEAEAAEVVERGVDVGEDRVVAADPDEVLDHRAEVAVVDDGAGPVRWNMSGATAW